MISLGATNSTVYTRWVPGMGQFTLRVLCLEQDLDTIYAWVQQDYAKYWGMQGKPFEALRLEYETLMASTHATAFVGLLEGSKVFLCEFYMPTYDPVGEYYEAKPSDLGMHVLVAPTDKPISGFTQQVFTTIMDFMFSDAGVDRVVVEPDINNEKIHILNRKAGFVYEKEIQMPHKTAALAFCTRAQYEKSVLFKENPNPNRMKNNITPPQAVISHLNPDNWAKANRLHLCKVISEFAHELLIAPELKFVKNGWDYYRLNPPLQPEIEYWFCAQKLSLNHWHIDPKTLKKSLKGESMPLDSALFFLEFKDLLGIGEEQFPNYLEEIISTLNGSAFMISKENLPVSALAKADYQTFEHAMTGGHPCFVANNGRIGFGADDYQHYAPEADQSIRLMWLAGHKSRTGYSAVEDLSYENLLLQELGTEVVNRFNQILMEKGLSPNMYFFIPIHPWQWYNKLAIICAPDLANHDLVCLGYGPEAYHAQQSIRTFYNLDHPEKFYTKTALSIINMGFVRGLTPYFMDSTPPITQWIKTTVGEDAYLKELGFTLLCEVATVGYRNFYYDRFGKKCAQNKMLSALWRESPATVLEPQQELMTMAALLHVDFEGNALLPELIKASGKTAEAWLRQYMKCYLSPLLHCFYEYDLVFMPHGENLILVMENQYPVKAIMKDITEEICVFNTDLDIPEKAKRICMDIPDELKSLSILTDVFDCFFRFMNPIWVAQCAQEESLFWKLVAECIHDYQVAYPQHADKFERYDLFAPEFTLSCLNRLQLRNHKQMVDLADPVGSLQFVGTLENPIAPYKNAELTETLLAKELHGVNR